MKLCTFLSKLWFIFFITIPISGQTAQVEDIYPTLNVSKSNISTWATPVAYKNGKVFFVAVMPPPKLSNGMDLNTVIYKGVQINNNWIWTSTSIDSTTLDDQWHNIPSIGIDPDGYIHVAYNMHTMPWQYSISKLPLDINAFEFKGDAISIVEKSAVKNFNKTPFPKIGNALIPGNQITYPAFFYDKNQDLYVTYRFAAYPKRSYMDRMFSAGIAKYNNQSKEWLAIGGTIPLSNRDADFSDSHLSSITSFASDMGWTVYLPRLAFDSINNMYVAWHWRKGGAGGDHTNPSYAWSKDNGETFNKSDGTAYHLPITYAEADKISSFESTTKFFGPTRLLISPSDTPYLLMQPIGQGRFLVHLDRHNNKWSSPEKTPDSALEFSFDGEGNMWAFSTGLKIFKRFDVIGEWKLVHSDTDSIAKKEKWCQPKVLSVPEERMFLVHSQSCDYTKIKITKVKWD